MFASGRPVQLAISYIPVSIAGGQDIALPDTGPTGLYQRLASRGYPVVRFAEQIGARPPRPDEATFLGLTEAQHVLEVTRIAYAKDDLPVETVINVFPASNGGCPTSGQRSSGGPMGELPRHSVSVTGIVFRDDGRVLAIQRSDDGR